VIDPVLLPLQSTLVVDVADMLKALGSVIVVVLFAIHPLASVMVTV